MTTLRLDVLGSPERLEFAVRRVLIAGFTGRDSTAVQAHLDELQVLGAPVPEKVPLIIPLNANQLTTKKHLYVNGQFTSGEAEPVVVFDGGRRFLTVGSDHTDREIERESIVRSKEACDKVMASSVIDLDSLGDPDAVELESFLDEDEHAYQHGSLAHLLPLPDIERTAKSLGWALGDGDVLFMGTLPVSDGALRPARRFRAILRHPSSSQQIELNYTVSVRTGVFDAEA
jgi:hypothetical protein